MQDWNNLVEQRSLDREVLSQLGDPDGQIEVCQRAGWISILGFWSGNIKVKQWLSW